MQIVGDNFDDIYGRLLRVLSTDPDFVCSPRGQKIKENLVTTLVLTNPRARLLTNPAREANYGFAVGEFLWYWRGSNDLETMRYYNKRMSSFSDDGQTLNSAYGKRLRIDRVDPGPSPIQHVSVVSCSQWHTAIDTLLQDPDSRRAVMHINRPDDQARANGWGSKDVPCTLSFQFFVRDKKLHLHVLMRSNDVLWGLTYDEFSFTLLQECMLMELRKHERFVDLELGSYFHTAGSMHLYEQHFDLATNIVRLAEKIQPPVPMQRLELGDIDILMKEEHLLRNKEIDQIDPGQFKSGAAAWMAQQLNSHRMKRNAE